MSNEKKRKSASTHSEQPAKRQTNAETVHVRHIYAPDHEKPVIASSPGIATPLNLHFRPFSKKSKDESSDLLLHSSEHPTIDFTSTEAAGPREKHLKHYVAVFEPDSGVLKVTKAKHLNLRRLVRQDEPDSRDGEEEQNVAITNYASRAALTEAFGTKKSRKAVQSMAENRQMGQGNEGVSIADAMAANLPEEEDMIQMNDARSNKPLPKANLLTEDIEDVYPLGELVFPTPSSHTLELLHPTNWLARLGAGKEIKGLRSRFVANRIGYIGKALLASPEASDPKLVQCTRLLRYIELLVEINTYLSRLSPKRPVPFPDKWPPQTLMQGIPQAIIKPLLMEFLRDRTPTVHAMTLLRSTILAVALHVPPPSLQPGAGMLMTEPTDLALDLAMEAVEVRKLYRELGCKVEGAKEKELKLWHLERLDKKRKNESGQTLPAPVFAKLKLPLEFPKVSRGRPSQRR